MANTVMRRVRAFTLLAMSCGVLLGCAGSRAPSSSISSNKASETRIKRSIEIQRVSQPLSEWISLRPDELKLITHRRLVSDNAALIIVRLANRASSDTPPPSFGIRNIDNISNSKTVDLQLTGDPKKSGWGAALLKPGRYGPVNLKMKLRVDYSTKGIQQTYIPLGTPAQVLRAREQARTIRIKAGEVVYIGTRKWKKKKGSTPATYRILNEEKSARAWLRKYAPPLSTAMVVRLYKLSNKQRALAAKAAKKATAQRVKKKTN